MVVQTLDRNPGHFGLMGLHIGVTNVQQYFPRGLELIELELDHLCIACPLEPSFWEDRPEIHDMRLSIWLEAKRLSGKLPTNPAPLAMIPCGRSAFRLQIIVHEEFGHASGIQTANQPGTQTGASAMAYVSPMASSLAAVDRRRRSVERHPERRKVGKLKNNERPAPAASH
jgi:hypothetical protein